MKDNETDKLKHKEYDGIKEYDNPLPRWWLLTFYITIGFSFLYWSYYHIIGKGSSSAEQLIEFKDEQAKKANLAIENLTDEQLLAYSKDKEKVKAGRAIFEQNCVICHSNNGGGGIGPNLTDNYSLHGSKPTDMLKVVMNGVLDKGMPAWKTLLGPVKTQEVVAYLLTIKGTNVPGGKAPQGELDPK